MNPVMIFSKDFMQEATKASEFVRLSTIISFRNQLTKMTQYKLNVCFSVCLKNFRLSGQRESSVRFARGADSNLAALNFYIFFFK